MNYLRRFNRWHPSLIALGALHSLSFAIGPLPGWALPFVQIFSLSFLAFYVFASRTVAQAALGAFLFGLGNFALGLYWLYISMHYYGGMPALMAGAAVMVMAAGMALFYAMASAVARRISDLHLDSLGSYQGQILVASVWASSWTLLEWVRGTLFTGFPWLNIGYAHVEGVLAGWAPLLGLYGLTWLSAFAAAAIALLARAKDTQNDARAAIGVGLAIVAGLVGILLGHIAWSKPHGEALIVRLVQANVPQSEKFDPVLAQRGLQAYMELAALAPKEPEGEPSVIVLPETIMPTFQDRIPPQLWQQWLDIAANRNAHIVMGVPLHDRLDGQDRYTNGVLGFDASTPLSALQEASTGMRYDKHHLVPFGEFVPPGFRWFVDAMQIPLGDFNRGTVRQNLFAINGQMLAPNICYEDVFGEEIIQSVRDSEQFGPGANILVNMSNLGWFGNSWALRQHLQISRMRAMETARPMIRATNTGMTAAIAPNGTVRAALEPAQKGVLDVEVQGMTGLTPYVRWGNAPILAWTGLLLLLGIWRRKRVDPGS